jgi:hypothetical protein
MVALAAGEGICGDAGSTWVDVATGADVAIEPPCDSTGDESTGIGCGAHAASARIPIIKKITLVKLHFVNIFILLWKDISITFSL